MLFIRFDIGSVIAQEKIVIDPDETYVELYEKLAILGANALTSTITQLPDVLNTAKPQLEDDVTYGTKE